MKFATVMNRRYIVSNNTNIFMINFVNTSFLHKKKKSSLVLSHLEKRTKITKKIIKTTIKLENNQFRGAWGGENKKCQQTH